MKKLLVKIFDSALTSFMFAWMIWLGPTGGAIVLALIVVVSLLKGVAFSRLFEKAPILPGASDAVTGFADPAILRGRRVIVRFLDIKEIPAATMWNKREITMLFNRDMAHLPSNEFIGVVLHELKHVVFGRWLHIARFLLDPLMGVAVLMASLQGYDQRDSLLVSIAIAVAASVTRMILFTLMRQRELACDRYAHEQGGHIVSALLTLDMLARRRGLIPVHLPFNLQNLFSTHPSLEKRIRALRPHGRTLIWTTSVPQIIRQHEIETELRALKYAGDMLQIILAEQRT